MFSVPDIAVIGVLALLLFGPDKLPGILRQAGKFMREVQNTSHSFVAEMERAADVNAEPKPQPRVVEQLIAPDLAPEPELDSGLPLEPEGSELPAVDANGAPVPKDPERG
jgi:TatA/E family protein of Tat protein translocase